MKVPTPELSIRVVPLRVKFPAVIATFPVAVVIPVAPVMAPAPVMSKEFVFKIFPEGAVPSIKMASVRVPAVLVICKALVRVPEAAFCSMNKPLVVVSGVFKFTK